MSDLLDLDKKLAKMFGPDYYGLKKTAPPVEYLSTGHPDLDYVMGGGLPAGRVIELFGNPSGGKSTTTFKCIEAVQKAGMTAAYVDVERAWSEYYGRQCGINTQDLLLYEPDTAEQALEFVRAVCQEPSIRLIVLDSVANLTPSAEYEKEVGSSAIAAVGRMMSLTMRQLVNYAAKSGNTLMFVNQVRAANMGGYGPAKDTPGGAALKFNASIRLEVSKKTSIEVKGEVVGITSSIKAIKNKVGVPFRSAEVNMYFPPEDWTEADPQVYGLDVPISVIRMALKKGVLTKKGAWYNYDGQQFQGEANLRNKLIEDPTLLDKIRNETAHVAAAPAPAVDESEEDDAYLPEDEAV